MSSTESTTIDYERIVFECRDILRCGDVRNVVRQLERLKYRLNDALARIAQLTVSTQTPTTHETQT